MLDIQVQLNRIEKAINKILETLQNERSPIDVKWLSEQQAMQILNLSKRGIAKIRKKNLIRCSSATGRNFLYYKADVESYLFDHSAVTKRRKNTAGNDENKRWFFNGNTRGKKREETGRKCNML
jgi:hypothetical protein